MRASVVGRHFDIDVVSAASDRPHAQVRAAIERAACLQLVVATSRERYSFRHALTRDIVYAEALAARLRPVHRRITRALEESTRRGTELLEELAYHAWASGDAERTLLYNELAGDNAASVHALEDACRYYRRARSLLDVDTATYSRLTRKLDVAEGLQQ